MCVCVCVCFVFVPAMSQMRRAVGEAPSAISAYSLERCLASTVLTMNKLTIASTPGMYTHLYEPADILTSQRPSIISMEGHYRGHFENVCRV